MEARSPKVNVHYDNDGTLWIDDLVCCGEKVKIRSDRPDSLECLHCGKFVVDTLGFDVCDIIPVDYDD